MNTLHNMFNLFSKDYIFCMARNIKSREVPDISPHCRAMGDAAFSRVSSRDHTLHLPLWIDVKRGWIQTIETGGFLSSSPLKQNLFCLCCCAHVAGRILKMVNLCAQHATTNSQLKFTFGGQNHEFPKYGVFNTFNWKKA